MKTLPDRARRLRKRRNEHHAHHAHAGWIRRLRAIPWMATFVQVAQIATPTIAVIVYVHTVLPLQQKVELEEQIAEHRLELRRVKNNVEASKAEARRHREHALEMESELRRTEERVEAATIEVAKNQRELDKKKLDLRRANQAISATQQQLEAVRGEFDELLVRTSTLEYRLFFDKLPGVLAGQCVRFEADASIADCFKRVMLSHFRQVRAVGDVPLQLSADDQARILKRVMELGLELDKQSTRLRRQLAAAAAAAGDDKIASDRLKMIKGRFEGGALRSLHALAYAKYSE